MKVLAIVFVLGLVGIIILIFFQVFIYNVIISAYHLLIRIAAIINPKAKLWVSGRKNLFQSLSANYAPNGKRVAWFHCASLGEFEQGRSVIELLKNEHPNLYIVLTFYSPSGYEVRKNYPFADLVCYLPADSAANANKFIEIIKPDLVVFVKYEFWYHYLNTLSKNKIPVMLISGIFRKNQLFFKRYGRLHKSMLNKFTHLFVQNETSLALLNKSKITHAQIAYDTRFDRVNTIAQNNKKYPEIEAFTKGCNVIIAGSTWPADEEIIANAFYKSLVDVNFKLIVAPHQLDARNLAKTKRKFKKFSLIYSELNQATDADIAGKRIMILDTMGMLADIYKYADVNYIGGGFNNGVHNTLEAAVYGKPILFGPKYKKFDEILGLVKANAGFPIRSSDDLLNRINLMNQFQFVHKGAGLEAYDYIQKRLGGSEVVARYLTTFIDK